MKDIFQSAACNQLLVLPLLMDFYKKIARAQQVRFGFDREKSGICSWEV